MTYWFPLAIALFALIFSFVLVRVHAPAAFAAYCALGLALPEDRDRFIHRYTWFCRAMALLVTLLTVVDLVGRIS
jgi:hypothetical protein